MVDKLPPDIESIARHECRVLLAKYERLPKEVRALLENNTILAFTAGAAWALDIDSTFLFAPPPTSESKQ